MEFVLGLVGPFFNQISPNVDVEPDSMSGFVGVSHTPSAWLLAIMDFPQPYCSFVDQ
jgi:hypothetical protein